MYDYTTENLEWFFDSIAKFQVAYQEPQLAFLIHDDGEQNRLISGKLIFSPSTTNSPEKVIKCGGFFGFRGKLSRVNVEPKTMLQSLINGRLPFDDQTFLLSVSDGNPSFHKVVSPYGGTSPNSPLNFKLNGNFFSRTPIHYIGSNSWDDKVLSEIRTAETPYSDLNDLLGDLELLPHNSGFDVEAMAPLLVANDSVVDGEVATLKLIKSSKLPIEHISLGAIVHGKDAINQRIKIKGDEFQWHASGDNSEVAIGEFKLDVPKTSVVHCFANYEKTCFHNQWIGDPNAQKNYLRNIYELFDPEFKKAFQYLTQDKKQGNSSGQEIAVSWLLWVLGFSPMYTGGLHDAPDVIAVSKDGRVLIIECTLGDLKSSRDNKIQKLLDRTKMVEKSLKRSNMNHLESIPVAITSHNSADIQDDIIECGRKGIVIYSADDLAEISTLTISQADSNARYQEMRLRLDRAKIDTTKKDRKLDELAKDMDKIKRGSPDVGRSGF